MILAMVCMEQPTNKEGHVLQSNTLLSLLLLKKYIYYGGAQL